MEDDERGGESDSYGGGGEDIWGDAERIVASLGWSQNYILDNPDRVLGETKMWITQDLAYLNNPEIWAPILLEEAGPFRRGDKGDGQEGWK